MKAINPGDQDPRGSRPKKKIHVDQAFIERGNCELLKSEMMTKQWQGEPEVRDSLRKTFYRAACLSLPMDVAVHAVHEGLENTEVSSELEPLIQIAKISYDLFQLNSKTRRN